MLKLSSVLRNPLAFFFTRSTAEEQVVAYLTREHRRGRSVGDILTDRYVQNRLSHTQQMRLLERPQLVHTLGEHDVAAARDVLNSRGR